MFFFNNTIPIYVTFKSLQYSTMLRSSLDFFVISLERVVVSSPKIVINLLRTYEKLPCKGEPVRIMGLWYIYCINSTIIVNGLSMAAKKKFYNVLGDILQNKWFYRLLNFRWRYFLCLFSCLGLGLLRPKFKFMCHSQIIFKWKVNI